MALLDRLFCLCCVLFCDKRTENTCRNNVVFTDFIIFVVVISWSVPAGAYMCWSLIAGICVFLYHYILFFQVICLWMTGMEVACVCASHWSLQESSLQRVVVFPPFPKPSHPHVVTGRTSGCGQGAAAALTTHSLFKLTVWCTTDGTGPGMATSRLLCWANVDLTFSITAFTTPRS